MGGIGGQTDVRVIYLKRVLPASKDSFNGGLAVLASYNFRVEYGLFACPTQAILSSYFGRNSNILYPNPIVKAQEPMVLLLAILVGIGTSCCELLSRDSIPPRGQP